MTKTEALVRLLEKARIQERTWPTKEAAQDTLLSLMEVLAARPMLTPEHLEMVGGLVVMLLVDDDSDVAANRTLDEWLAEGAPLRGIQLPKKVAP